MRGVSVYGNDSGGLPQGASHALRCTVGLHCLLTLAVSLVAWASF